MPKKTKRNTQPDRPTDEPVAETDDQELTGTSEQESEETEELDEQPKAEDRSPVSKKSTKKNGAGAAGQSSGTQPTVVRSSSAKKRSPLLWVWVGLGVILLGGLTALGLTVFDAPEPTMTNSPVANIPVTEQLVPRAIDGVLVPADQANTNLYAIMIENIKESRPPSGLDEASVIYEALAEGGITRFMALFPTSEGLSEIGPVRSARHYYVHWAEEYKPLYVHIGGSPQALSYLRKANVIDFNQFANAGFFWRDKTKRAPHNVYTSTDKLFLGLKRRAPNAAPTYTPWIFKDEVPLDSRPGVTKDLVIEFSSFNYRVTYKYDRALNQYQRWHGDTEHVTKKGVKLTAKNIVIQYTKTGLLPREKQRLDMTTTGQGKMLMVRDGAVVEGTWKKENVTSRTQFLDAEGNVLALNPGLTWIEIVPLDRKVTY